MKHFGSTKLISDRIKSEENLPNLLVKRNPAIVGTRIRITTAVARNVHSLVDLAASWH
jgi:hypothetical protein